MALNDHSLDWLCLQNPVKQHTQVIQGLHAGLRCYKQLVKNNYEVKLAPWMQKMQLIYAIHMTFVLQNHGPLITKITLQLILRTNFFVTNAKIKVK